MTYARVSDGVVVEIVTPMSGFTLAECFHSEVVAQCVAVPTGQAVEPGWTYTSGVFSAPAAPSAPTLAQQAQALLGGTIAITSTSTPALNGSYAIDAGTQAHMTAEMLSVQVTGKFADGTTTVAWPDASGAVHTFPSVAEFQAFALAVSAFVATCYKVINGVLSTLPTPAATIP